MGVNQNSKKTNCSKGHPLSGDNLRIAKNGWRICKQCQRNASLTYHRTPVGKANEAAYRKSHIKERLEAGRKRRIFLRNLIYEIKSAPCTDCHKKYPAYVMDLDHVRGAKFKDVSSMVDAGMSVQKVLIEVSKCDVVCSNCHRLRTHKRRGTIIN